MRRVLRISDLANIFFKSNAAIYQNLSVESLPLDVEYAYFKRTGPRPIKVVDADHFLWMMEEAVSEGLMEAMAEYVEFMVKINQRHLLELPMDFPMVWRREYEKGTTLDSLSSTWKVPAITIARHIRRAGGVVKRARSL